MSERIRVLIVDDHAIVRKGIRVLLSTVPGIEVVGEAQDGKEAIVQVREKCPDVVLMDLVMPGLDGITAIDHITTLQPDTRVLVLTGYITDERILSAIKAGALGYLLKDIGADELVQAIHEVHRGEASLHPLVARKLLQELSQSLPQSPGSLPLTDRELEVLRLVAQGQHNRQIADALQIRETTVRTHISSILKKLHLTSRTQAALFALREGLASLDDARN